ERVPFPMWLGQSIGNDSARSQSQQQCESAELRIYRSHQQRLALKKLESLNCEGMRLLDPGPE
ncbi:MAG: hypothetical protein KDA81_15650, partial [Planctomycetaceae bacterium]|nr:hypothetical protein [Planctomycetaceae bacterium]